MNTRSASCSKVNTSQTTAPTNSENSCKSRKRPAPEDNGTGPVPIKTAKKIIAVDYLSSTGSRKKLESVEDGSARFEAVKALSDYECQICCYVNEKTIQTRCCESVICASCYLSLPHPKQCPSDKESFAGDIQVSLKAAGRLIDNQVERFVALVGGAGLASEDTGLITGLDAEKSQKQNDAIRQIKSNAPQNNANTSASHTPDTSSRVRSVNYGGGWNFISGLTNLPSGVISGLANFSSGVISGLANFSSGVNVTISSQDSSSDSDSDGISFISGGNIHIEGGGRSGGLTINGRRIQGRNLVIRNGQLVSGQNVTVMNTGQASRNNPIRTHDFSADDVIFIDVHTRRGDIVIEGQNNRENEDKVSIKSSKLPRLSGNILSLDCDENVSIKVPASFDRNLKLHTNMGDVRTQNDYIIKSGGNIHSHMGNVDIKVDSMLVKAKGKTNMGSKSIRVGNHSVDRERKELLAKSNMGNVNVRD